MNYNHPNRQRAPQWIHILVGAFCCAFCYCYLWRVHGGVLAMAQHILSRAQTIYYPAIDALVLTVVFWLLHYVLNFITRLRGEWYAVSYFPSFLALAVLTSIDANVYTGMPFGHWTWGLPLSILVYISVAVFLRGKSLFREFRGNGLDLKLLMPNLITILAFVLFTSICSFTNKELHNQFDVDLALSKADYNRALMIGRNNYFVNKSTSAMRAFALARCGQLGERLFEYPQDFGSEGLLIDRSDSLRTMFHVDSVYYYLGAYPSAQTPTTMKFLQYLDLSERQRKPMAKDYYLAALLLDKKLPEFVTELNRIHPIENDTVFPRHYQEALVLYRHRFQPDLSYVNDKMEEAYEAYQSDMRKGLDDKAASSLAGEHHGKTYWWYYDFANSKNDR